MEKNKYTNDGFQKIDGQVHLSPNENLCINGQWFYWKDMTLLQKKEKKECKLRIAESSHDKVMEEFWQSVVVE